jgi:hypothetical protein
MLPDGAAMLFHKTIPQGVSRRTQKDKDLWPSERQGYSDVRRMAYAPMVETALPATHRALPIETEERVSTLIVVAGMIAAAHAVFSNLSGLLRFHLFPPGPLEICALGVLVWLHAKWRRLVKPD